MKWVGCSLVAVLCCAGMPLLALDLTLPGNARETASRDSQLDQEAIPTAAFGNGELPVRIIEGAVTRRAYRIPSSGLTPLQILAPLRQQLAAAGYEVLLDCNQDLCGGFDFRFGIDVLPAPNMYVNIRSYHFLSAQQTETGAAVTLLASAASGAGYLQIVQIGESAAVAIEQEQEQAAPATAPDAVQAPPPDAGSIGARLLSSGSAIFRGIEFSVGTTSLGQMKHPELEAVATFLEARPGARIAVVGHTDTVGGLEANIAVSRARAEAVRTALIDTYGVAPDRVDAEGVGYLSPVASNLTAAGREENRRVEVVLLGETE